MNLNKKELDPLLERISLINFDHLYTPSRRIILHISMWLFFISLLFFNYWLGDYLKIVTNTETFTTLATLKSMEAILLPPVFLRVQRSFMVKITSVKSVSGNMIELNNGKIITIASNKKDELFNLLGI